MSELDNNIFDEMESSEDYEEEKVSSEDKNERIAQVVAGNLEATKLFDPVEVQAGTAAVHIMGRVKKQDEKVFVDEVIYPLLKRSEELGVGGYIGIQYFLKGGALRYGWVISFQSNSVLSFQSDAYSLCDSFAQAVVVNEVMEAPLMGRSTAQSGGRSSGRKGASLTTGVG